MLYIHETPLHFGLIIVSWIIALLFVLVGFQYHPNGRKEQVERRWLNFLWSFFLFFAFSILAVMIYQLPAAASVDQLMPYFLGLWSCYSLYAFFDVFYSFSLDLGPKQTWLKYLFLIGTISFLAVLWIFATPATTWLVFDGQMNWLALPIGVIGYGCFLAIFYVFLFPFITTYRLNKGRKGGVIIGNWLIWFGIALVDITALLIALVLFLGPYMLIALGLAAVGMIISLIGGIFNFWILSRKPAP